MAVNEEVTMMLSVMPGAMTGISTMMGGLVSINNVFMDMTRQIDASFGLIDTSIITAGTIVAQFGFQAAQAFGEFEQGMKIAQMVSGQTRQDIQELSRVANEFSVQYRTDIDQITEGLQTLGRAGLNSASEQTEVLREGLSTAKLESRDLNGVLEELIQNTALLGGNLNSSNFGEQSQYINDLLVATSMTAPITTHDVSETLKYSGGIAAAAGANIESEEGKRILEDYMGAIAAFAQKGVTGSIAGTALRAFFNKPATQDSSVKEALASIKLKPEYLWEDDEETMKPVSEQIGLIQNQMDKLDVSTMDRLQIWSKIVGGKMGQQMMKLDSDSIKTLTQDIRAADDAGSLAAGTFQTFQSNMKEMSEQGQVAFRTWGERVTAVLNPIIALITKFLELLSNPIASYALFAGFLGIINNAASRIKNVFGNLKSEVSTVMDYIRNGEKLYAMRPSTVRKFNRKNSEGAYKPFEKKDDTFDYDSNYRTSNPVDKYNKQRQQRELENFLSNNKLSIADANILKQRVSPDKEGLLKIPGFTELQKRLTNLEGLGINDEILPELLKGRGQKVDTINAAIRLLQTHGGWKSDYTKRIERQDSSVFQDIVTDALGLTDNNETVVENLNNVRKTAEEKQTDFFKRIFGLTNRSESFFKLTQQDKKLLRQAMNNAINKSYSPYGLSIGDPIDEHPEILENVFKRATAQVQENNHTLSTGQKIYDYFGESLENRLLTFSSKVRPVSYRSVIGPDGIASKQVSKLERYPIEEEGLLNSLRSSFGFFRENTRYYDRDENNPFTQGMEDYTQRRLDIISKVLGPYVNKIGPFKMALGGWSEMFAPETAPEFKGLYNVAKRYGITKEEFEAYQRYQFFGEHGMFNGMSRKEVSRFAHTIKGIGGIDPGSNRLNVLKNPKTGEIVYDYADEVDYGVSDDFKRKFYHDYQRNKLDLKDKKNSLYAAALQKSNSSFNLLNSIDGKVNVDIPVDLLTTDRAISYKEFSTMHTDSGKRLYKVVTDEAQRADLWRAYKQKVEEIRKEVKDISEKIQETNQLVNNMPEIDEKSIQKNATKVKMPSVKSLKKKEWEALHNVFTMTWDDPKTKAGYRKDIFDSAQSEIIEGLFDYNTIDVSAIDKLSNRTQLNYLGNLFKVDFNQKTSSEELKELIKKQVLSLQEVASSQPIIIEIPLKYVLQENLKLLGKEDSLKTALLRGYGDKFSLEEFEKQYGLDNLSENPLKNPLLRGYEDKFSMEEFENKYVDKRVLNDYQGYEDYARETLVIEDEIDTTEKYIRAKDALVKETIQLVHKMQEEGNKAFMDNQPDLVYKPNKKDYMTEEFEKYMESHPGEEQELSEEKRSIPANYVGYDVFYKKEQEEEEKRIDEALKSAQFSVNPQRSRWEFLKNPFSGMLSGFENRVSGFWKGLQTSKTDSFLRTKSDSTKTLTRIQRVGNVAANVMDMMGGPWMVAMEGATIAVQKFQEAQQAYVEKVKTLLTNLDEAIEKQNEAETIFFEGKHEEGEVEIKGWSEEHEDATAEEKEAALLEAYGKIFDNSTKGLGELDKNTQQLAIATEQVKQTGDQIGALFLDGSFFSGNGPWDYIMEGAQSSWNFLDFFTNVLGGAGSIISAGIGLPGAIGGLGGGDSYTDKFGETHPGYGKSYFDEGQFQIAGWQNREDYPWAKEMDSLFAADVWKRGSTEEGLKELLGYRGYNRLDDQLSSTGGWKNSAWTKQGKNIQEYFGSAEEQNRLQMGLKNYGQDFSKLAKQTRRFEKKTGTTAVKAFAKEFNKTKGNLRKTLKNLSVQDPKLVSYIKSLSIKTGMTAQQVLMAAQLQQLKEMQSIAKEQVTPRMENLVTSAYDQVAYGKQTLGTVQGSGSGAISAARNAAAIASLLHAEMEDKLDKESFKEYQSASVFKGDPTKAKYKTPEEFAAAVQYAMNNPTAENAWLRKYGETKSKAHAATNFMMWNPELSPDDAAKRAEEWWNNSPSHKGSAVTDTLRKGGIGALTNAILDAYDASLEDKEGDGSGGNGSGSGNKDNNDNGTRKERVDLVLCNRKTIPKLNVNLFKKPPSFTILNKNFKLRDVKINSEDKPKAIMAAIKNSFIDIQKRTDPKIIQDEDAVYDPAAATDGTNVPSGSAKTNTS